MVEVLYLLVVFEGFSQAATQMISYSLQSTLKDCFYSTLTIRGVLKTEGQPSAKNENLAQSSRKPKQLKRSYILQALVIAE